MNLFKTKLLILIIILLSFNGFLSSKEVAEKNLTPLDGELLLPEGYNNTAEEKNVLLYAVNGGKIVFSISILLLQERAQVENAEEYVNHLQKTCY